MKSATEKVRDSEARKRASGLREIRVWVPDRDKFGLDAENRVRKLAADESAAAQLVDAAQQREQGE
jgi:hypothetical protein